MSRPRLTFFCELEAAPLEELFSLPEVAVLSDLEAGVSLGILDLSPERAGVVKRLNQAGIPAIAWLLLPYDQGYWFNLDNAALAAERYAAFKQWSDANDLNWSAIGLDIEPDIRELEQLRLRRWQALLTVASRLFNGRRLREARDTYHSLVDKIRADGYPVHSYQFPFIVDERAARSTLLQRAAGLIDIDSDREVLMLYTSFIRPNGPGVLWSYGRQAQSIGIGSTGGGVELDILEHRPLSWEELSRDLRLAWVFTDNIHVFSLEGCIREGYLNRLKDFEWDQPIFEPSEMAEKVERLRGPFKTILWVGTHPILVAGGILAALFVLSRLRRKR